MKKLIKVSIFLAAVVLSSQVYAATVLFWDFENPVTVGAVSSFSPTSSASYITGSASQNGGGPAENFGSIVHLTRFFGEQNNYPFITFTTTVQLVLDSLTFTHYHNHNTGFPTNPDYDVQLQLDSGSGFVDIGGPLNLSAANSGDTSSMGINTVLQAGSYTLRWVPRNLNGTNTNTEFFAMDNLTVNGALALEPKTAPTLSFWAFLLLGLLLIALAYSTILRHKA